MKNKINTDVPAMLDKHRKSDKIKWVIVYAMLVFLMLALVVTVWGVFYLHYSGNIPSDTPQKVVEGIKEEVGNLGKSEMAVSSIQMLSSGVTGETYVPDNMDLQAGTITKRVRAGVVPFTAQNRNITWSLSWKDTSVTLPISDYIEIEVNTDFSDWIMTKDSYADSEAIVTCKKEFAGIILLTATTEEGGYSTSVEVVFKGEVTNLAAESNNAFMVDDYCHIPIGQEGTYFDITCQNVISGEVARPAGAELYVTCDVEGYFTLYNSQDKTSLNVSAYDFNETYKLFNLVVDQENFRVNVNLTGHESGIWGYTNEETWEDLEFEYDTIIFNEGYFTFTFHVWPGEFAVEDFEHVFLTVKVVLDNTLVTGVQSSQDTLEF